MWPVCIFHKPSAHGYGYETGNKKNETKSRIEHVAKTLWFQIGKKNKHQKEIRTFWWLKGWLIVYCNHSRMITSGNQKLAITKWGLRSLQCLNNYGFTNMFLCTLHIALLWIKSHYIYKAMVFCHLRYCFSRQSTFYAMLYAIWNAHGKYGILSKKLLMLLFSNTSDSRTCAFPCKLICGQVDFNLIKLSFSMTITAFLWLSQFESNVYSIFLVYRIRMFLTTWSKIWTSF